jgi:hypothetical protein
MDPLRTAVTRLARLPPSWAIVIGAGLIAWALSNNVSERYKLYPAAMAGFWLFDTQTEELRLCTSQIGPFELACSKPRRAPEFLPTP